MVLMMVKRVNLGIDADNGEGKFPLKRIVEAAVRLAQDFPDDEVTLFGDIESIKRQIRVQPVNLTAEHAVMKYDQCDPEKVIPQTSLYDLVRGVSEGRIHAAVSIGDAAQVVSVFSEGLRKRRFCKPSFVVKVPFVGGTYIYGDVGVSQERAMHPNNPSNEETHILARDTYNQGLMSIAYARESGIKRPRVGVLCNGTESYKGNDLMVETVRIFEEMVSRTNLGRDIEFIGRAEPRDGDNGKLDVLVTSGVLGNVNLKQLEADARKLEVVAYDEIRRSPLLWPAIPYFWILGRKMKRRLHPDENSGAMLFGFSDVVAVKDHGGANSKAIYSSGRRAMERYRSGLGRSMRDFVLEYGFVKGSKN